MLFYHSWSTWRKTFRQVFLPSDFFLSTMNFATAQKNDKICEHCKKMATTGSSPYEILWTLRGGMGKEFLSQVLERKMLLRITDIKQAEGVFLEYCRNLCLHTMEGKIWDETGKRNYKKGKTLHFQSLREEEKYTKLGKKEFKRLKKKIESTLGVKKTTEAKKKPTKERSRTTEDSYVKIYKSLMPSLNLLNRLSSSRSLQLPSLDDDMELSLRQAPDQTTTMSGSDSNTTDTSEDHTTETSFEMTGRDTTEETTEPTTTESDESTESFEESYEDDSTEEESNETKEPKGVSPKPNKSQDKDIENLINYILSLTSDPDADLIFKRLISLTRSIVKCMIDITLAEVERALGIAPGSLVRERCGTSEESTSLESTILNFFKGILEQTSNLQSVIPLSGLLLPPTPVPDLQPIFQPEVPPSFEFQPEVPRTFEFQPNYPDLPAPIQNYNDYNVGTPQQVISNLIPPPPIISPPFLPQNNNFEEEPNYPDYPETESFIAFPDLSQPPPQPFLPPSLGSTDAFANFIVWRRTMSDIRNQDGNDDEEQQ